MPSRNSILIAGLALFLIWYVSNWAYQSLYVEPRQRLGEEIKTLSEQIAAGRNSLALMTQFNTQNQAFYYRSLPQTPNDARSQYTLWLLELLQYSGFESNNVNDSAPTRIPLGANYQFTIRCTGTLSQLSYFLFEFYYAPFLHRITSMTLSPIEGNSEQLTFSMTVNALALNPYPYAAKNQIPTTGNIPRLMSNNLATYQVIADRNLLQTAKGGIDRAEYTVLTAILDIGDQTEVWFSVRTDDSLIRAKLGDPIQAGSFSGKIVEILDQDIVLERNGERWLLTTGERISEAFALPPETAGEDE